jgi:hypothetical protein
MTDLCDARRVTGLVASDAFDRFLHAHARIRAIEKTCHNESLVTQSSNLQITANGVEDTRPLPSARNSPQASRAGRGASLRCLSDSAVAL